MQNAPFPERDGVGALVFKDKIFLLGGWDPRQNPTTNSEVWSSTDGQQWELVTAKAPWPERHCAGYVVYQDKMWVISGDGNDDVWSSADGANWQQVLGNAPWGKRYKPYVIVYKNKIWLIGGLDVDNDYKPLNDVWVTEDGANWQQINAEADWTARGIIHGGVVFQDKLWVIGGGDYGYPLNKHAENYYNDIWNTEDGITWHKVSQTAPWRPRIHHSIHVYAGRMWVMAGHNFNYYDYLFKDVWYSADGLNWQELKNSPFPERHATTVFNFKDKMWMVLGYFHNDIWNLEVKGLTFMSDPVTTVRQGDRYSYQAYADFHKTESPLTYQLLKAPAWLSIDTLTGAVTGLAPCKPQTEIAVEIAAFTASGDTTIQRFSLSVIPPENPITISVVGDCQNQEVTLRSDLELSHYLWSTGDTTREIKVSQAGQYQLFYTHENGCRDSSNVVTLPAFPEIVVQNLSSGSRVLSTQYKEHITWYRNEVFFSDKASISADRPGVYYATYSGGPCLLFSKAESFDNGARPEVNLSAAASFFNSAFELRITFSKIVSRFTIDDLELDNGVASQLQETSPGQFRVLITPKVDGQVNIGLPADKAFDTEGNGNKAAAPLSITFDTTQPEIIISRENVGPVNKSFQVSLSSSEPILGFDAPIVTEGFTLSSFSRQSSQLYTAIAIPAKEGEIKLQLTGGITRDLAGNSNMASNVLQVVFDSVAPKGYSVNFTQRKIDYQNHTGVSIQIQNAEPGTRYYYQINSSAGGKPILDSALVTAENFIIDQINVSQLNDGNLTLSLVLKDTAGNLGLAASDQVIKHTKNVQHYALADTIRVPFYSTGKELPGSVEVTYSSGEKEQVSVSWQLQTFNGMAVGPVVITGILNLPADATNYLNIQPRLVVVVLPNKVPTALTLSQHVFRADLPGLDEASALAESIGLFSTSDPDDQVHQYRLIAGSGDTHNALFGIKDNKLYLLSNKGLSGQTSFSIRVRTTDPWGNTFEQVLVLTKGAFTKSFEELRHVNAFSPNGDGINDTWVIPDLRFYNKVQVKVFDQAGQLLFESDNPEIGWDGKGPRGQLPKGNYFFILHIHDINVVKKGVLTIL